MSRLTLREYQTEPRVRLSAEERDALIRSMPSLTMRPSVGLERHYDLTPSSHVGAVEVGSLSVSVVPKIPVSRVMFLISYALDPANWHSGGFNFEEENSLLEAIIPGFVRQLQRALRRGVLEGYRTEEASLTTVRGRLRIGDQLRERFGATPPAEVTYDEFTEDIEENRLIKAALDRLGSMRIRNRLLGRSLRRFDSALERVGLVRYDPRSIPEIRYTRLNEHYRPPVELARLILRSDSYELRHGAVRGTSFLVDMNRVFEGFVVVALREALGVSERSFPQGARGRRLFLDKGRRVSLEPDISWWEGERCAFVGDVKYKALSESGVVHSDLYQLLSYVIACDLPGGLLVYGSGGDVIAHDIERAGKSLEVISLDLSSPPEQILRNLGELAGRVRNLRMRTSRSRDHFACSREGVPGRQDAESEAQRRPHQRQGLRASGPKKPKLP
ncbi:MAG: McrC family protein [Actinomycetota bacterium]|nr:McrC family protein [Actinomycetota bacterium]